MNADGFRLSEQESSPRNNELTVSGKAKRSAKLPKEPKGLTLAPEDFRLTDAMKTWANERGISKELIDQTERFLDHHRARGTKFKDWTAAWRTWMRNFLKFNAERNGTDPDAALLELERNAR